MNTLIIFDLDGTLADTRADLAHAVNLTRKFYGFKELTLDEIINYVGSGRESLIEQSFHDEPEINIDEACDKWSEYYSKNLTVNTRLYEEASEGIQSLHKKGCHLGVCSNKPGDMCREITAYFKLDQYLVATIGSGDLSTMKPEPEGVLELINKAEANGFKREKDNVWMIGDHHTDINAAKASGARSIFCNYGFGKRNGLTADFEVNSFNEIVKIISQHAKSN